MLVGGAVLLAVVLLVWGRLNDPSRALVKNWKAIGVKCLPQGHVNLAQHIHLKLTVSMDGQLVAVPANIGQVKTCMSEMHTHDTSGTIHIESAEAGTTFTLGQFFQVRGEPLDKNGYRLTATADGQKIENPAEFILKDSQQIILEYQK